MDYLAHWPHLADLCAVAGTVPGLEMWLFGSAVNSRDPNDIDVLLIYSDLASVGAVRAQRWWADEDPPIHIIAMTEAEATEYDFIAATRAKRLWGGV